MIRGSHDPHSSILDTNSRTLRATMWSVPELWPHRRTEPVAMPKEKNCRSDQRRGRPKLLHVSEETKRLAQLLEAEILTWPNVTSRPMFGLNGIYRGSNIFAVLPRTRAMDVPYSI